jgi:hypothetical protein
MVWFKNILRRETSLSDHERLLKEFATFCIYMRSAAFLMAKSEFVDNAIADIATTEAERQALRAKLRDKFSSTDSYYDVDRIAWIFVGVELSVQFTMYFGVTSAEHLQFFVQHIFQNSLLMSANQLPASVGTCLGAYQETKEQLVNESKRPAEEREGLHPLAIRMGIGILVGNKIALDFISKWHNGGTEIVPDEATSELVFKEIFKRHRTFETDEEREIPPTLYISDVGKWVRGSAS